MPAVIVEMAPPEPPRVLTAALIDACSSSVESGQCSIAAQSGDPNAAHAVVAWESAAHLRAFVDVTIPGGLTHEPRHRTLDFGQSDAEEERFRAVGLTIATLSSELERAESEARAAAGAAPEPAGTASPSSTSSSSPAHSEPSRPPSREPSLDEGSSSSPHASTGKSIARRHRLWATAGGVLGPGLSDGTYRYGAGLDIGVRPTEGPWFVSLGGAASFRARDARGVAAQWKEVVARVGVSLEKGSLLLEPWIGAGFQTLDAEVRDPATAARDSGDSENLGVYLGVFGGYAFGPVAVVLGLDGRHFPRKTEILVRDQEVGSAQATSWSANLGVRVFLE